MKNTVVFYIFNLFQSSGVAVSDECKTHFEAVKKDKKYRLGFVLLSLRVRAPKIRIYLGLG